jgi:hypothetical protein
MPPPTLTSPPLLFARFTLSLSLPTARPLPSSSGRVRLLAIAFFAMMSSLKWKVSLLMACIVSTGSFAFHHPDPRGQVRNFSRHCGMGRRRRINTAAAAMTDHVVAEGGAIVPGKNPSGACYYKRMDGSWKPRKEMNKLFVGERLFATRLPER